ncbi:MAG: electron transport complex protein RnfA [candidate division WOR-3 bacterium]|nr:electron transport complex protein RnfA [candidate division WOR-3 bacterium]
MNLITIFIAAAFVNNFIFYRFLGICPFLGVSKRTESAVGMGAAVTFVMVVASIATWLIQHWLLVPFNLPFLRYVTFILVIASLVQIIEIYLRKEQEKLYESFGIYLPLITTNCAILGLVLLNVIKDYNFFESITFAIGAGFGFIMALVIMSGIRERLELAEVPETLQGVPIALIVAGLLALAFGGFSGML